MAAALRSSISDKGALGNSGLKSTLIVIIALLVAQFVLGMGVNLFAVFPSGSGNSAETVVESIVQTGLVLEIHVINGLAILALSAVAVYFSIRTRVHKVVILAILGIGFVILGLIGGVDFVLSGLGNDFDSFLMALGFVFAITSYFVEWNLCNQPILRFDQNTNNTNRR